MSFVTMFKPKFQVLEHDKLRYRSRAGKPCVTFGHTYRLVSFNTDFVRKYIKDNKYVAVHVDQENNLLGFSFHKEDVGGFTFRLSNGRSVVNFSATQVYQRLNLNFSELKKFCKIQETTQDGERIVFISLNE